MKLINLFLLLLLPILGQAAQRVYVANRGSNTVSVIDTSTDVVVASISVGVPIATAVSPDGTKAYVVLAGDAVAVIDTFTDTVITTFDVIGLGSSFTISILPDGTEAYI